MKLVALKIDGTFSYRLHDADSCKVLARSPRRGWAREVRIPVGVVHGCLQMAGGHLLMLSRLQPCRSCKVPVPAVPKSRTEDA